MPDQPTNTEETRMTCIDVDALTDQIAEERGLIHAYDRGELRDLVEVVTARVEQDVRQRDERRIAQRIAAALCGQEETAEAEGDEKWYGWSTDELAEFLADVLARGGSDAN